MGEGDARQSSAFISYARSDATVAAAIARSLEQNGVSAFLDSSLGVGESWAEVLAKAVRDADVVVVLLSPDYFSSRWSQSELSYAFEMKKVILPVVVRDCEVTGPLTYLNHFDLTRDDPRDIHRLTKLIEDLA